MGECKENKSQMEFNRGKDVEDAPEQVCLFICFYYYFFVVIDNNAMESTRIKKYLH